MSDKIFTLKNWYLEEHGRKEEDSVYWMAHGNVYGNPRFSEGYKIHTSEIRKIVVEETYLDVHTRNSVYRLPFAEMRDRETFLFLEQDAFFEADLWTEEKKEALKANILQEAKKKWDTEAAKRKAQLESLPQDCLCMVFSEKAHFYYEEFFEKKDGIVKQGIMRPHLGMFQDSVLLSLEELNEEPADYRYFPLNGNTIEFYVWYGYEGDIYIRNNGCYQLEIKGLAGNVLIFPGEIVLMQKQGELLYR